MSDGPASQVPVLWITGLSGVGKSSLAQALVAELARGGEAPLLLDGDEVRRRMPVTPEEGFDLGSRRARAMQLARLAYEAATHHRPVVVATISLFDEVQRWNRRHHARFAEIVLTAPLATLRRRNPALYADGANVWGVDLVPHYPPQAELWLAQDFTAAGRAAHLARALSLWRRLESM